MTDVLSRVFNLRRDEVGPALLAIGYFFCVLFGYFLIRPVREALGVERGWRDLHWLFIATAFAMLACMPIYGLLASRFRRGVFIPIVYLFFLSNLLGFWVLRTMAPEAIGVATGRAFYVWLSVFNLFATSMFWQIMADSFTLEQSKRIFPIVAVGGTVGAWAGSAFSWQLADVIGAVTLMPIAAGVIAVGVVFAGLLMRNAPSTTKEETAKADVWTASIRGASMVARRPYMIGVAGYIFALAISATFLYFAQAEIVSRVAEDTDERAGIFGMIDFLTQSTTLLLQLLVVGRLMRFVGVGLTLCLLPILSVILVGVVALWPTLLAITLAQAAFRAGKYAIARPARETLFTVLSREEKYEAKAVMDTFVYRAGDVAGAGVSALMAVLSPVFFLIGFILLPVGATLAAPGLAAVGVIMAPLGLAWGALGVALGRAQNKLSKPPD